MRIKWILLVGGLCVTLLAVSAWFPDGNRVLAQSGCCKVRSSTTGQWSKRLDLSFAACRDLNQQRDKDIFQPTGLVWWDRSCS